MYEADLAQMSPSALAAIFGIHDVVINTAGYVAQGHTFAALTDHIVTSLESIPENKRPVSWFMAGAALLDMDENGRRAVDLPVIRSTYWPHGVNFDRIRQTALDLAHPLSGPTGGSATTGSGPNADLAGPITGPNVCIFKVSA